MNTRQKLTIGIAAIFMVTLTIVGVTYAYFVTRVEGLDEEVDATVTTASLAKVEYAEGNDKVTLTDALPGESVYKTFKVVNMNPDNAAQYDVTLAASDGDVKFIYTDDDPEDTGCYVAGINALTTQADIEALRTAKADACYEAGKEYNSVEYYLYDVTDSLTADSEATTDVNERDNAFNALTTETSITDLLNTATHEGNVQQGTTKLAPQTLAAGEVIEAGETRYYVLQIKYAESESNQNIENDAVLNMFVSIK